MRRLLLIALLLLACQLSQALPTPTPTTQQTGSTPSSATARPRPTRQEIELPELAPWSRWPPYVPPMVERPNSIRFTPSLEAIENPAALPALTDEQRRLLTEGPLYLAEVVDNPAVLLERQLRSGQPYWIGADQVLWRAAAIRQQVLRTVERDILTPWLAAWLARLAETTAGQQTAAVASGDALAASAARRNLAYLTIAAVQLNEAFPVDPLVADLVQSETDLMALGGQFQSPYNGLMIDYRRWPDQASPLVRSQTWLISVPLVDLNHPQVEPELQGRQLQLMLAAIGANEESAAWWASLSRLFEFLSAEVNAADADFWRRLQAAGYRPEELDLLLEEAAAQDNPAFFLLPPGRPWPEAVFDGLTFNRTGVYTGPPELRPFTRVETVVGAVRLRPHPLDLAAVLGSQPAVNFLAERGETGFERFDEQITTQAEALETIDLGLSVVLIEGLQPLLAAAGEGSARALDLWLMAAVNTPDGWGTVSPPEGLILYVEPLPALYAHQAAVTRYVRDALAAYQALTPSAALSLDQLAADLNGLAAIAGRQLAGQAISFEDQARLASWVGAPPAGSLPRPVQFYPSEKSAVMTIDGAVPLLAIVPIEGRQVVVSGWTFVAKLGDR